MRRLSQSHGKAGGYRAPLPHRSAICHYGWHLSCVRNVLLLGPRLTAADLNADCLPRACPSCLTKHFSLLLLSDFSFLSHSPRPLIIPWTFQLPHQREMGCLVGQEAWVTTSFLLSTQHRQPYLLSSGGFFFSFCESYRVNSDFLMTKLKISTKPEKLCPLTIKGSQNFVSFKNVSLVRWKDSHN